MKQYSAAFLAQAAKEVEAIAKSSPNVVKMLGDYGITRDQIRVCLQKGTK